MSGKKAAMSVGMRQDQRLAVFGRMRMAEWIEMPEREFAGEIAKLEKDGLFRKLYEGSGARQGAIRRQRWPRGKFAGVSELNEHITPGGGERVKIEERLESRGGIFKKIEDMGREAFERYFLYAEEALPLAKIAERTGMSIEDARAINDFLVEVGAEAEFSTLPKSPQGTGSYCVARLTIDAGEPEFEFFSPHWARGLYQIRYDLLEEMKDSGELAEEDAKKLPALLKRLETVNLRQSTMFRIIETLSKVQAGYLESKREDAKKPISLRMLARRLDLAPSTVSRALSERTIKLPWGKEAPLIELLPGRRRQLRLILGRWLAEDPSPTDAAFAGRLKQDFGIAVSRRTVNAVRNELAKPAAPAAKPRRR